MHTKIRVERLISFYCLAGYVYKLRSFLWLVIGNLIGSPAPVAVLLREDRADSQPSSVPHIQKLYLTV